MSDTLLSLYNVWSMISERRAEVHNKQGYVVLTRQPTGDIQERYFPTAEKFFETFNSNHPVPEKSLVFDLRED